jgi:hypothetical protein
VTVNAQTGAGVAYGALARLLKPQTIAVVGRNDRSGLVDHIHPALDGGAEAVLVTPDDDTLLLIRVGDEAVADLSDHIDLLAADPDTPVIGLVVERIRDPEAFFAAARRATQAGRPIVLLKLGSGQDAWMYDVALRQAGITVVAGLDEFADRLALFEQLCRGDWSPAADLDVVAMRNGFVNAAADAPPPMTALPRPETVTGSPTEGQTLPFAATMEMLTAAGIPVAPCHLVPPDQNVLDARPPFAGPYVVKLADAWHRPEHPAVRLGVSAGCLAATITDLRVLAAGHGLSPLVVVQPQVEIVGEAFVGILANSEIGPLVLFGPGGLSERVPQRVGGRIAPLSMDDARSLIAEFADVAAIQGRPGEPAWDLEALAGILVAAGRLAVAARGWMDLLDLNSLLYSPSGFVAVDALCLMREEAPAS